MKVEVVNYLKMLVSHEIQGFFNFLDGAGPLAAEAAAGLSTVEVVGTFLERKNTPCWSHP